MRTRSVDAAASAMSVMMEDIAAARQVTGDETVRRPDIRTGYQAAFGRMRP
jgi:hypothetical protein